MKKYIVLTIATIFLWFTGACTFLGYNILHEEATTPYIKDPMSFRPSTTILSWALIGAILSAYSYSNALKKPVGPILSTFIGVIALGLLLLPKM